LSAKLSDRDLNRALLARQGLLEPFDAPLVEVVERIGALQGQQYNALPVALASRMATFAPDDLYAALQAGDLVWGTGLRGTLHLVSAREHPAYAVTAHRTEHWARRDGGETTEGMRALRAAVLEACAEPRTGAELGDLAEAWVSKHPDAIDPEEVEAQRAVKWRPIYRWSALMRVPTDGTWSTKAPTDHLVAPGPKRRPSRPKALDAVVHRHLRAFGPATPEDVAAWIGWSTPPVRDALEAAGDLEKLAGPDGRTLYDLPDGPRPGGDVDGPARYLAAFDSVLLAYAPGRRGRILPEGMQDVVYEKGNLRIRPSFLVDGVVAGTWSVAVKRKLATIECKPVKRLSKAARAALTEEGERLLRATQPAAADQRVAIA
jgi:winged helix DNA-binding protein